MTRLAIKLAIVFSLQAVMLWLFYRSRVISHFWWAGSDFIVFMSPILIGFAVALVIAFFGLPKMAIIKRVAASLGLSAIGTLVSSYVGTFIAFNLYAT